MIRLWYLLVFLFFLTATLSSCLSEDELDFPPEETDTLTVSPSVAIQSLLRSVELGKLTKDEPCIELFFPINLGFSNELTITINNLDGLEEVARSEAPGLHVNGVVFPFTASKVGDVRNIEDEEDLIELLEDCDLLTLRDEFDLFYTQCIDFDYPITMIDKEGSEVQIGSQEEYFAFERLQGFDEQPVFVFPLDVIVFSNDEVVEVTNHFELFEVFDTCERCPQLFFDVDFSGGTRYVFTADFEGIEDLFSYDWFINSDFIETDGVGVNGDNQLAETFEPGEYEICIKAETPDCVAGVEYCEFIEVEDPCPELSFAVEQLNNFTYKFTANFELKDQLVYVWSVFRLDDLIFEEVEEQGGDNILEFQFEPGEYSVCIFTETPDCPDGTEFCEEIIIP